MRARRTVRASWGIGLASLAVLLVSSAPALATPDDRERGGPARYKYKVTQFEYDAVGEVTGGRHPGAECTAFEDALWGGTVTTTGATELADLGPLGEATLKIGRKSSTMDIEAKMAVLSTLSNATHRESTACMDGSESAFTLSDCSGSTLESEQTVLTGFDEGVGNRVEMLWNFFEDDGSNLVPDSFKCVEPFEFPAEECKTTKTTLAKFTTKKVVLPFSCLSTTLVPPGPGYLQYSSTVSAKGKLHLKRTKQRGGRG